MSYRVNRSVGYQPWGVTNPWVWADYGQPQRLRGQVSPLVYMTQPLYLRSAHLNPRWPYFPSSHLGQVPTPGTPEAMEARGARMERYALLGVLFGGISLFITWQANRKRLAANRRKRRVGHRIRASAASWASAGITREEYAALKERRKKARKRRRR